LVANSQGAIKVFRVLAMVFLVGFSYSLLASWLVTDSPIQTRFLLTPGNHPTPPESKEWMEALNPDAQNLAIVDEQGHTVLSVRYVNESALVVSGIFFGVESGPVMVVEDGPILLAGHRALFSGNCFENPVGPLFRIP
jgi:hypothetical protein